MRRLVGFGLEVSATAALITGLMACASEDPKSAAPNPGLGATGFPTGGGAGTPGTTGAPIGNNTPGNNTPANPNNTTIPTTGGAGTGVVGTGTTPVVAGTAVPCNVNTVLATNCQTCHAAKPIGGAPMALVTYEDFQKPAVTMPTLKVYQLAKMRINDAAKPMPQGGQWKAATDKATLDTWLGAGATAGTAADKMCAAAMAPVTGALDATDGSTGALTALPGETCYEFKNHGSTTSVNTTKYQVETGERYEQFYFKVPWPAGSVATRYGTKYDNQQVLHHWLMFTTNESQADGYHEYRPLPTVSGTNASLLAGWAVGGTNLAMPSDVGMELPSSGMINVQWHFYNFGAVTQDASAVQICTVPMAMRPHIATISWVGTENLGGNKFTLGLTGAGMPAHQQSVFSGTCDPSRKGVAAADPIHIIGFWPHMHQLGTKMRSIVNHKGGMKEAVFEKAFDFNHQIHYLQNYDLMPGDTLTAECTFNNTTDAPVPFGESSDTEMCYNFTMAWPAHALENGVGSWIGATNTCWEDGDPGM